MLSSKIDTVYPVYITTKDHQDNPSESGLTGPRWLLLLHFDRWAPQQCNRNPASRRPRRKGWCTLASHDAWETSWRNWTQVKQLEKIRNLHWLEASIRLKHVANIIHKDAAKVREWQTDIAKNGTNTIPSKKWRQHNTTKQNTTRPVKSYEPLLIIRFSLDQLEDDHTEFYLNTVWLPAQLSQLVADEHLEADHPCLFAPTTVPAFTTPAPSVDTAPFGDAEQTKMLATIRFEREGGSRGMNGDLM